MHKAIQGSVHYWCDVLDIGIFSASLLYNAADLSSPALDLIVIDIPHLNV